MEGCLVHDRDKRMSVKQVKQLLANKITERGGKLQLQTADVVDENNVVEQERAIELNEKNDQAKLTELVNSFVEG